MFLLVELVVFAVIVLLFVAHEKGVGAFVATLAGGGIACFLAGVNPFVWIWANPLFAIQIVAAYMLVGLGWGMFKFFLKLTKARKAYLKEKADWINEGKSEQSFIDKIRNSYSKETYAPTVNRNKSNIGFWCVWWPFSVVSFAFSDLIQKTFELSWKMIKGMFGGMRSRVLGEAARDLD